MHYVNWHNKLYKLNINSEDIIIVDTYNINARDLNYLDKSCLKIYIIDDFGKKIFKKYTIIDWSISSFAANKLKISQKRNIIGSKYAPVKEKFFNKEIKIKQNLKRIFLSFGGSNLNNNAISIIKHLLVNYSQFEFNFFYISTKNSKAINKLEKKYKNFKQFKNLSEELYIMHLTKSDLAIVAGGHILFELALIGMPTIQLRSTYNQIVSIPWRYTGFSKYAGLINSRNVFVKIDRAIKYFNLFVNRFNSSQNGKKLINKNGTKNLVNKICQNHNL